MDLVDFAMWLKPLIVANAYPITFFAIMIWGDISLLAVSFLAAQGYLSIILVFIIALVATFVADSLWFFLAKSVIIRKIPIWKPFTGAYEGAEKRIYRISRHNDLIMLLISKFIYGTRVITIAYLGDKKKVSYLKFIRDDTISSLLWLTFLTPLGWLAGRGFVWVYAAFDNLRLAITLLVAAIVLLILFERFVKKRFFNKSSI